MNLLKIFSSNVRYYRKLKNLSQEELAFKCGLHRTYISSIECLKRNISIENIEKIADALDVEAYILLRERRKD
ncbi:helix-turn-helix domain-containing protein [Longibaculum muris]|mgnify:CR=1 FL=1|uniref:helix-turn-helix domain-containing protein n=1 Tax=Longibaculum muris TaxID=1796628 RepID=UPI00189CFAC3|nr:helix-turn-helix transcriptional regulator [Longibaculum muris]